MPVAANDVAYCLEDTPKHMPLQDFDGKISIIMPAYNEQFHISKTISETRKVLDESDCDYEIIIVDDGSTDDTFMEASKIGSLCGEVRVVKCESNGGKGHAVKFGFNHARGELVVFLDADLDLHPEQINSLYEYLNTCQADVVIGSKRHPRSKLDYPFHRKIVSNVYYFFIKALFGLPIKDTQTGIKIFKHEVLENIFPQVFVKRYAFDLELLVNAHHLGYKIAEAPIVLDFKRNGRIRLIDIYHVLIDTMAIFYRLHILKCYDKPEYDKSKKRRSSESIDNYSS